jgi:hypothetical protein
MVGMVTPVATGITAVDITVVDIAVGTVNQGVNG